VLAALAMPAVAASTTNWWDVDWRLRDEITVTTGSLSPDRGYDGYTARITGYDTAQLITDGTLQSDCDDLRILYWNGSAYTELGRHIIGCDTATTDIRFQLQADITASSTDNNYYIFYNNPNADTATNDGVELDTTNVYLWWDDTVSDLRTSYNEGRGDAWHGNGTAPGFGYNAGGDYYTFDTGDNFTGTFRTLETGAGVTQTERDVYIEAEWYHSGCYNNNISSGLIVRGQSSGSPESSSHYYATNRGEFNGCGNPYGQDGDIVKDGRTGTAVNGTNPTDVATNTWDFAALAAFDAASGNDVNLRWWDEDITGNNFAAVGYPGASPLHVSGQDTNNENNGRGYAGILVAQDAGRIREVLIRRYVEPEPTTALGGVEAALPDITVTKSSSVDSDPLGQDTYQVPGSVITYTLDVDNAGDGGTDEGTLVITDILPTDVVMCVASPCASGDAIVFTDSDNDTGLTYTYANDVRYTDETSPTYSFDIAPASLNPDTDGYDSSVTGFQIDFSTTTRLDPSDAGDDREFTLTYDVKIE
jgi:uncharacterized repeat protein (TIGR01451 family)